MRRFWISAAAGLLLTAGPARATSVYALIDTGELYVSSDGGASWLPRATLPARDAVGLAAGATSSELFLVTRSGSVYRGSVGARNFWTPAGAIQASDVAGFTIGPFGALLALTRSGTLYSSGNQGATFSALAALTASDWVSLARGPLGRLYALAETGQVAESKDQGTTWTTVGVLTTTNAVALRRLGNALYVLTKTGEVYRSINYGVSWTTVAALTSSSMGSLVDLDTSLLAAASEGEVASSGNGAAWTWVGAVNQLHVVALATDTPMVTGVTEEAQAPRFTIRAPAPNPSPSAAGAVFSLNSGRPGPVRVELFDAQGRLVAMRQLVASDPGGALSFRWPAGTVPAGTYLVRARAGPGGSAAVKWTVLH